MNVLYVDRPFAGGLGGDASRSRWLWQSLNRQNRVDLVLVESTPSPIVAADYGSPPLLRALTARPGRLLTPHAIDVFDAATLEAFREWVATGRYDAVVFRFISSCALLDAIPAGTRVVFDADMLLWRISSLAWQQQPTLKNRWHFIQKLLLEPFERRLFSRSCLFFFTNAVERDWAAACAPADEARRFVVLPNTMPDPDPQLLGPKSAGAERYILFFGALDSVANVDALQWIRQELLTRLQPLLRDGYELWIAGKNPSSEVRAWVEAREGLRLVSNPPELLPLIAGAAFCWLPLRVASGTRTRILEAAAVGTPVCTTALGAEGLELGSAGLWLHPQGDDLGEFLRDKLGDPPTEAALSLWRAEARSTYGRNEVGQRLQAELEAFQPQ